MCVVCACVCVCVVCVCVCVGGGGEGGQPLIWWLDLKGACIHVHIKHALHNTFAITTNNFWNSF